MRRERLLDARYPERSICDSPANRNAESRDLFSCGLSMKRGVSGGSAHSSRDSRSLYSPLICFADQLTRSG